MPFKLIIPGLRTVATFSPFIAVWCQRGIRRMVPTYGLSVAQVFASELWAHVTSTGHSRHIEVFLFSPHIQGFKRAQQVQSLLLELEHAAIICKERLAQEKIRAGQMASRGELRGD